MTSLVWISKTIIFWTVSSTVAAESPSHSLIDFIAGSMGSPSCIAIIRSGLWLLTQFYSVDFSKSRIVVKVRVLQTHNQGLRQLLLTVSWDLRA